MIGRIKTIIKKTEYKDFLVIPLIGFFIYLITAVVSGIYDAALRIIQLTLKAFDISRIKINPKELFVILLTGIDKAINRYNVAFSLALGTIGFLWLKHSDMKRVEDNIVKSNKSKTLDQENKSIYIDLEAKHSLNMLDESDQEIIKQLRLYNISDMDFTYLKGYERFICPLSKKIMKQPVTAADGITYDLTSLIKLHQIGNRTCPGNDSKQLDIASLEFNMSIAKEILAGIKQIEREDEKYFKLAERCLIK